ncbi:Branched-chain amino acid aminotransferase II [Penicillium lagena]|uniref:Branched-chain amino acid aminotransferase II n=1 Tax=Penicillium lagena TaxID=94218 RepID=UPI00253FF56E|nr:Branched-chain amino acid aminotransferase II [Penicillium lagena]KAJ5623857.1 Branched-chain amino acid aminotransferase II [Penicillium lagena]
MKALQWIGTRMVEVDVLAKLRGARKVSTVGKDVQRLRIPEDFGMTPMDVITHPDVGDYLLSIQPHGLQRSIEASWFRST